MASLNLPQPKSEYRAFEIFDEMAPGHALYPVRGTRNAPHLRHGEFAVIDLNDKTFVSGEIYLLQYETSLPRRVRVTYSLSQLVERRLQKDKQETGVWFLPLNNPRDGDEAGRQIDDGTIHMSDGPLNPMYLPEYIVGRVIGIYQGDLQFPMISAQRQPAEVTP